MPRTPRPTRYATEVLQSRTGCVQRKPGTECSAVYGDKVFENGVWDEYGKCLFRDILLYNDIEKTSAQNEIWVDGTLCPEANLRYPHRDHLKKSNPCQYINMPTCSAAEDPDALNPFRYHNVYDEELATAGCINRRPGRACHRIAKKKDTERYKVFLGQWAANGACELPATPNGYDWDTPAANPCVRGKMNAKTKSCTYDAMWASCK